MSWIEEWIFPRRCPVCLDIVQPSGAWICRECRDRLKRVEEPRCFCCGRQLLHGQEEEYCTDCASKKRSFVRGIVGFDYNSVPVRRMISEVKYHNKRQLLDYPCLDMAGRYDTLVKSWHLQCLIPVPLHWIRQHKRGFNQSREIAKRLSAVWNIPVDGEILYRVRPTKPQKELDEAARVYNLSGAFAVKKERVQRLSRAALVDDIFTTGSTAEACVKVLRQAGVKQVYCISLASGSN